MAVPDLSGGGDRRVLSAKVIVEDRISTPRRLPARLIVPSESARCPTPMAADAGAVPLATPPMLTEPTRVPVLPEQIGSAGRNRVARRDAVEVRPAVASAPGQLRPRLRR